MNPFMACFAVMALIYFLIGFWAVAIHCSAAIVICVLGLLVCSLGWSISNRCLN